MHFAKNIFVLLLLIPLENVAQFPKLDSARMVFYTAANPQERLSALLGIASFRNSMSGDSIHHYARLMRKLAIELNDTKALARAEYQLISGDLTAGKTDSVIPKIENNPHFKTIKQSDPELYYKIQLLKANVLNRTGRLPEALALQLKLLSEAEKENNTLARLFLMNYTGATYLNASYNREEARKTWEQALGIIRQSGKAEYREIETYILSNLALYYIGNYYNNPKVPLKDTCFDFINRTVTLSREIESMGVLASALTYRGGFKGYLKQFESAEVDFTEALAIRKKIGDPLYISEDLKNLALFYLQQKKSAKALNAAEEGLQICATFNIRETALELYNLKASTYKMNGDLPKYTELLERMIVFSDSVNRLKNDEKITAIRTQYDVQKKETLIAQQELDLFKRNIYLYAGAVFFGIITVFAVYRFKKYQQNHRRILEQKQLQAETNIREAQEKERNRIAAELHDNLGVQANAILHNSNRLATESVYDSPVVGRLQETAKEMLHNLRETLWALKSADVNAVELWLRVIGFMQQMGRHYTGMRFIVTGKAPKAIVLSASRALHIILVIQETVNNAVKHSGADIISAESSFYNNEWIIHIKDNGKGFDTLMAENKKDSYGLQHMKQRAVEGGFEYNLESVLNVGTTTTIRVSSTDILV